jgi:hypothetical protein
MNELDELGLYQNLLGSRNAFNSLANRGATTQSTIDFNDVLKASLEEEEDDADSELVTDVKGLPDTMRVVDGKIEYKPKEMPIGFFNKAFNRAADFGLALLGNRNPKTGRPYDFDRQDPPSIKDFPVKSLVKKGKGAEGKDVFSKKVDKTIDKLLETTFKQQQLNLLLEEQAQPLRMARLKEMGEQGLILAAAAQKIRDSSDPARQQQLTEAAKQSSILRQTQAIAEQVATERAIKNFYNPSNYA